MADDLFFAEGAFQQVWEDMEKRELDGWELFVNDPASATQIFRRCHPQAPELHEFKVCRCATACPAAAHPA